ncbi:MAG: adenosylcobinamide-GDP ribazoletransferase [Thermoproteota archaeon]
MMKKLASVIGFLTIIPARKEDSLKDVVEGIYFFPLVGGFIGLIGGLTAFLTAGHSAGILSGLAALAAITLISGGQHADGLLDLGDAFMHQASKADRIRVMRDSRIGAGGFLLGFFLYALTAVAIANVERIRVIGTLVAVEALAKNSMVFTGFMGFPASNGAGGFFAENLKGKTGLIRVAAASALSLAISSLLMGCLGALLFLFSLLISMAVLQCSKRLLGGLTGDVLGAVGEIARGALLLAGGWR